jgi:phosphoribosylformylglycinamidine cyclo-ligase
MKQNSYKAAGVDIEAGDQLVDRIQSLAEKTLRPGVLAGIGGFGALFELSWARYKQPVLVSSTDGVGTKLKLAMMLGKHDTIGIDLVAMSVNDVIVQGAEPLFFLDYYATSRLHLAIAGEVLKGIVAGCEMAGAALVGGETAEMPGMYQGDEYDLAGFCVGIVEKDKIIDGRLVKPGDVILGLASSGVHSNGYSLVRHILTEKNIDLNSAFAGKTFGEILLAPTKIYVKSLLQLISQVSVHGMAHITGGGLLDNIPRVLPANTQAVLHRDSWPRAEIFHWLQSQGNIADEEMFRTFNCGIGMVVIVRAADAEKAMTILTDAGEQVFQMGEIVESQSTQKVFIQ